MGTILVYALQSTVTMTILYWVYKWLLSSETFHAVNRGVILAIYCISFIAPALFPMIEAPADGGMSINLDILPAPASLETETPQPMTPLWLTAILYLYLAGIMIMAGRLIYTGIRITRLIHSGEKIAGATYTTVISDDTRIAPFSWGRYVVMNRADYVQSEQAITIHESHHIACRHWIDLLIAETGLIFNWFSPAAWLLKDELRTVHEYQADMAVLHSGADARSYQLLLIAKAVGSKFSSLANSLNHSKLKKRIAMMMQPKSSKRKAWRALAFIPASAAIIALVNMPAVASAFDTIGDVALTQTELQTKPATDSIKQDTIRIVGVSSKFKGKVSAINTDSTTSVNREYRYDGAPAIFVSDKQITYDDMSSLDPSTIESIRVSKDDPAYPNGVIYITLKSSSSAD